MAKVKTNGGLKIDNITKMKKGVIMTVGMLLLASVVFSLSVLIFHNTASLNDRFGEIALFDRLYELDNSISNGMKTIFEDKSGITITKSNNSLEFSEIIPRSTDFGGAVDSFVSYMENAYKSSPKVVFDNSTLSTLKSNLPIYVEPEGFVYTHNSFGGDQIFVNPQSTGDIKGYDIIVNSTASSAVISWPQLTSGSLPVSIKIFYAGGTAADSKNVNPSSNNQAIMTLTYSVSDIRNVTLDISNPAALVLNAGANEIAVTTNITINPDEDKQIKVTYPDYFYNITFPESNLTKTSTARIL